MAFFFSKAHQDIDWQKPHEFLDKELQKIVPEAETGNRLVDKLVKVWQKKGVERWVLIHVEVQGNKETDFAKRMYIYNHRLFDRFDRHTASLAILTHEQANWRPSAYSYTLWDCHTELRFPIVKLIDYEAQWAQLETSRNPFAVVVMAHLKTLATKGNNEDRYDWRLRLAKNLYNEGYKRQDIINLFRFIEWLMVLPPELEAKFDEAIKGYEEAKQMTYVTSIERRGIKKGLEEGIQQGRQEGRQEGIQRGIIAVLEVRFGPLAEETITKIGQIQAIPTLDNLLKEAAITPALAQFETVLADDVTEVEEDDADIA